MLKIYTKTGDWGSSSLGRRGERVAKSDKRFHLIGDIDELISVLGLAAANTGDEELLHEITQVQKYLYKTCSHLAEFEIFETKDVIDALEKKIDQMTDVMPKLNKFIAPGGSVFSSQVYVARAVCRRAERLCVEIASVFQPAQDMLTFLNRLSDYLFTLARFGNFRGRHSEQELSFNA